MAKIDGSDGNDHLADKDTGSADVIAARKGDDFIFTHSGEDEVFGGAGDDFLEAHNFEDFRFDGGFGRDGIDFQIKFGCDFKINEIDSDRTVIRIIDAETHEVVQRIVLINVEDISWYSVG